jgi:DNA repair exonuclease SbcCD nuclease subunit
MLTLTHIADTHLGHRQYGVKQREDDMMSTLQAAITEMTAERDTDAILLPGDLFDSRDLRPKVIDQAERIFADVPEDVPILVSRGNHDENLSPREVTWLNYLHQRGHVVFLNADLETNPETAQFDIYNPDDPGYAAGFYDIATDGLERPVRVFGLQWRGARAAKALQQVANGITRVNNSHGQPAYTVLLGHFGIEDEVPTLGGTVTHADLRELKQVVDYLAIGHIHKQYEAAGWIYNPGSPEAHTTREGRDDWNHGYYSIALNQQTSSDTDIVTSEVTHHLTKRRPYYRVEFDVTAYSSAGELEKAFKQHVKAEKSTLLAHCRQDRFTANGEPRSPIVDLRFTGTLQFTRGDFRTDELSAWVEDAYDALYVQLNTGIRTADVQQLIADIDEADVFEDGQLNTAALESEVFETIAQESVYAEQASNVADVLGNAHQMAQTNEAVEDIQESVSSARQELFPHKVDDIVLDIDEDPFANQTHNDRIDTNTTQRQLGQSETNDTVGVGE